MDTEGFKKRGKANRAKGKAFELKVRADLEKQGWIVTKWANQVAFGVMKGKKVFKGEIDGVSQGHLIPAKSQYNPFFKRIIGEGSGFPDFIAFKLSQKENLYELIAIECKFGKYLSEEEKQKCDWLLSNKKFQKILVAFPGEKRGEIIYKEYSRDK